MTFTILGRCYNKHTCIGTVQQQRHCIRQPSEVLQSFEEHLGWLPLAVTVRSPGNICNTKMKSYSQNSNVIIIHPMPTTRLWYESINDLCIWCDSIISWMYNVWLRCMYEQIIFKWKRGFFLLYDVWVDDYWNVRINWWLKPLFWFIFVMDASVLYMIYGGNNKYNQKD